MSIGQGKYEGEIMIDHRASPGLPAEMAQKLGLEPRQFGEGAVFEGAVLACIHCGGLQLKNPDRKRPRNFCMSCSRYICDICAAVSKQAGYVHRNINEISDMVESGRYTASGSSSAPILTKVT